MSTTNHKMLGSPTGNPEAAKELKKRWSHFIRKVYETDPLTCPKCQGEMREQIRITVLHEIAHYFGIDEEDIEKLGY